MKILLHRNSQKRYYNENYIYFIVTKTFQNFPYFTEKMFCEILINELRICKKLKQFKLYAFCLVYDHLNLLVQPNKKYNISKIMKSLKENTSRDINYVLFDYQYEGDTSTCRPRMREIIHIMRKKFHEKYKSKPTNIPKFQWQDSFKDHIIRGKRDYENHYHYTIYNHLKHNLPDNWQCTSLNYKDMIDELTDDKPFAWRPFIKN